MFSINKFYLAIWNRIYLNKRIDVKLKLGCSHIKLASLQKYKNWIRYPLETQKEREQKDSFLCCSLCVFLPLQTKYKQHSLLPCHGHLIPNNGMRPSSSSSKRDTYCLITFFVRYNQYFDFFAIFMETLRTHFIAFQIANHFNWFKSVQIPKQKGKGNEQN